MIARRNIRAVIHGVVAAALAVALIGCTSPFLADEPSGDDTGGLRISGVASGGVSTQTVFPSFELTDVASYEVSLSNGPSGSTEPNTIDVAANDSDGQFADTVAFEDLVPGEWDLTVDGYDADGNKVVSNGGQTISITRGEYNETTATVELLDTDVNSGDGNLTATVTWPVDPDEDDYDETDVVTGYSYKIEGLDNENSYEVDYDGTDRTTTGDNFGDFTENLDNTTDPRSLTIEDTGGVPAGIYFLDVKLISDNASPYETVAHYSEVWYVYENVETSKTRDLSESDFSFGGGASITVALEDVADLNEFVDGGVTNSTVAAGETYSITAAPKDDSGTSLSNYDVRWKIDTEYVTDGAFEETVTIYESDGTTAVGTLTVTDDNSGTLTVEPASDFPAGRTFHITMQVEDQDENMYYSVDHSVTVE